MKKKLFMGLLALLVFSMSLSGCFATGYYNPDSNERLLVTEGDLFTITLTEPVGYTNKIRAYDSEYLELVDMHTIPNNLHNNIHCDDFMVGGMAKNVYVFKALKSGRTNLTILSGYGSLEESFIQIKIVGTSSEAQENLLHIYHPIPPAPNPNAR